MSASACSRRPLIERVFALASTKRRLAADELGLGAESLLDLCLWLRRRSERGAGPGDAGPGADVVALGTPMNYDDSAWARVRWALSGSPHLECLET